MKQILPLLLQYINHVGRKTTHSLLASLDCVDIPNSVEQIYGLLLESSDVFRKLNVSCTDMILAYNMANRTIEASQKLDIKIISCLDNGFPSELAQIQDPPTFLFYKGSFSSTLVLKRIAVIGTRTPSEHGKKIAKRLGEVLAQNEICVVSGLAIGCDTQAHRGCVSLKGKSIAVLPSSVNSIYPKQNANLADEIVSCGGCLISEYPIGHEVFKNNFIERDRLQSALSDAVLIVETGLKGGSMHTANYAIEQHKLLACYINNNLHESQSSEDGCRELVKCGKAMSIENEIDMTGFLCAVNNRKESHNSGEDTVDDFTQMSFL